MNPLRLSHLNLPSKDPTTLARWYVDNLGFQTDGRYLWSGGTLLVVVEGASSWENDVHFGFRLDTPEEVRTWRDRLRRLGIEVGRLHGEGYLSFFVKDPEGNRVEFFHQATPEPSKDGADGKCEP